MRKLLACTIAAVATVALLLSTDTAWADSPPSDDVGVSAEIEQILADQLRTQPGGTVVGNTIRYEDDLTFVAVEVGVMSASQCASGKFCGWALANYSGSFFSTSGSGVIRSLSWSARSYRNHRSKAARLYNNAGTGSTCFAAETSRPTISSSYYSPAKVHLSSTTSC